MTCAKGTETSDLVCPTASHPRAIGPNAVGAGKVDFSGGISQTPVPANFRMPDNTFEGAHIAVEKLNKYARNQTTLLERRLI
jgi:hypothetical protein